METFAKRPNDLSPDKWEILSNTSALEVFAKMSDTELDENQTKILADTSAADLFVQMRRETPESETDKSFAKTHKKALTVLAAGVALAGAGTVAQNVPAVRETEVEASRNVRNVFSTAREMYDEMNPSTAQKADAKMKFIIVQNGDSGEIGGAKVFPSVPKLSNTVREESSENGGKIVVDTNSGEEWILSEDGAIQQYFPPTE